MKLIIVVVGSAVEVEFNWERVFCCLLNKKWCEYTARKLSAVCGIESSRSQ